MARPTEPTPNWLFKAVAVRTGQGALVVIGGFCAILFFHVHDRLPTPTHRFAGGQAGDVHVVMLPTPSSITEYFVQPVDIGSGNELVPRFQH